MTNKNNMKKRERLYLRSKKLERKIINILVEEVTMAINKEIMHKILLSTEVPFERINKII
jgi:hypothetical protein